MLTEQPGVDLDALLQANPNISAQRERTGTIWVTQDLNNGRVRVMTVHPLWENDSQIEPAVAIEVREMDKDFKTRKYSEERPEIVVKPIIGGTVSISVDESYGKIDPAINTQDVIRQTRIGLSMLEAVGILPEEKRSRYAGKAHDDMRPRTEIINDLQSTVPVVANVTQELDIEAPQIVPRAQFVSYAVKLLGKIPEGPAITSV
ncbi:hypothetical protein A2W14_02625 [Candidatus Gottesmanbacteria bacterium RBG_16_37_8]|uniref:Uncharacterized protein n=1 Tax=Candidatus Gottesmanbacteria bacterium RBG_16_37_8 TaxID=1798371 RepID=A0A1F5YRJ3_9BACT|nr:MAG: hypothetical protein A2W14_02625 [Candidatus Gottesmanbacteria bacterium RBG_16_37_8]